MSDGDCCWCENGADPAQWHTACWDEAHMNWEDEADNA